MSQHFLLSAKARTLSLANVLRMSEDEAFATMKELRWASTQGEPVCPHCGSLTIYSFKARRIFKCRDCIRQFSVTSGTIFASRKLPMRDYLAAVAIFVNGAKGHNALQLSRDLDVQYKTAFVLAHKIREAMGVDDDRVLAGKVEIDGAYFGGVVRQKNRKEDRKDRRLPEHQNGKRRSVIIVRERHGRSLAFVAKSEADATVVISQRVAAGSELYADEGQGWNTLAAYFEMRRINHKKSFAEGDISTNWAESYFSRLRRAEIGVHHSISDRYLEAYAKEMSWREDNRRISNGEQFIAAGGSALRHPVSRQWKGYWQSSAKR